MDKNNEEKYVKGKGIENNGITILKDISDEDVEKLQYVENNGIMLVPRRILSALSSKGIENNGILAPYEEGMKINSGSMKLDASALEALDEPLAIVQAGMLVFSDDITPELAKSKIKDIKNYGQVIAPEKIYGVVMSKVSENFGKVSKPGENHGHHHGHGDED